MEKQYPQLVQNLEYFLQQQPDAQIFGKIKEEIANIEGFVNANQQLVQLWQEYKKDRANQMKLRGNDYLTTQGNNERAIYAFSACIELDPSNYVFYSNRSAAFANVAQYYEALKDAEKVIELNPQWARGYGRKAVACFFLKRYDEALDAYKKGLQLEPNNEAMKAGIVQVETKVKAQNLNERGEELISKNKLNEAVNHLTEAIALDPYEPAFYGNRFDAFMGLGNAVKALEDADQFVRLRPDNPKGFQRRAEALTRLERFDEAAAAYGFALKLEPTNSKYQMDMNNVIQEGVRYRMRKNMQAQQQQQQQQTDQQ